MFNIGYRLLDHTLYTKLTLAMLLEGWRKPVHIGSEGSVRYLGLV